MKFLVGLGLLIREGKDLIALCLTKSGTPFPDELQIFYARELEATDPEKAILTYLEWVGKAVRTN